MSSPLISCILPVYNGSLTIERAIQSIINQSFTDWELLIINNGSTDDTESVVLTFKDERLIYYSLQEANLAAALNFGIGQSNGKYIARMDADDYSYPDRFRLQSDFLDTHTEYGLVSGLVKYNGNVEQNEGYYRHVDWANRIKSTKEIYLSRFQDSALPHPSVMFRKSIAEEHGFYSTDSLPEDFDLWNRWMFKGVRMTKINEVVIDWSDDPKRLSRNHDNYSKDAFARVKAEYFSKWLERKFKNNKPRIFIWGTGSTVKRESKYLKDYGIEIAAFIDVKRGNSTATIHYSEISFGPDTFILSYVHDWIGKEKVHSYLLDGHQVEGQNFYMMN